MFRKIYSSESVPLDVSEHFRAMRRFAVLMAVAGMLLTALALAASASRQAGYGRTASDEWMSVSTLAVVLNDGRVLKAH